MAMVRYLLDEVKLDVNGLDRPEVPELPPGCSARKVYCTLPPEHQSRHGTPICYIPGSQWLERDTRELTWLLLDHGADPTPAFEIAKDCDYPRFIEDVEAWKAQQRGDRRCCVQ